MGWGLKMHNVGMMELTESPLRKLCLPFDPVEEPDYSGFPWWYAMVVESNSEAKAANKLERLGINVYWPRYSRVVRRRGSQSTRRFYTCIPGLLFVPVEFWEAVADREAVKDWAGIYHLLPQAGSVGRFSKAEIDRIREIEAVLNLPSTAVPASNGKEIKPGCIVRFRHSIMAWLGDGKVKRVDNSEKIVIEVNQLLGARREICMRASEIEVI